jgi:hypothetical protein
VARPRRRWLRLTLVLLPVTIVGLLLALGGTLTCRPSWYQPVSIDYGRLEDDKRAQLGLENRISAALNDRRPVEVELDEAQVNRWIAARHELWPTEAPSLEPFERPQIVFLSDNRVRVAALAKRAGVRVVLSATFRIDLQSDGIVVKCDAVHTGALPTPRRLIEKAAGTLADRLRLDRATVSAGIMTLPNEGTWPNGKRRFRITDLSIEDGRAHLKLAPE